MLGKWSNIRKRELISAQSMVAVAKEKQDNRSQVV